MKKTSSVGVATRVKSASRSLALGLLVFAAVVTGMGLDRMLVESGYAATKFSRIDNYTILEETYQAIRENYVLQEDVSDETLVYGAAKGMVESLGDTEHSRFLTPDETKAWNESIQGQLVGVGIRINYEGELPVVMSVIKGGPAEAAGVKPGDTIVSVDGTDLHGVEQEKVGSMIRGEEGTDVTLQLIHENETKPYEVTITRAKIEVNPVDWVMLPNGVLWLRLDQFSEGATDELKAAIEKGKSLGMTSVILDLRGNPGGLVAEAQGVASQFLSDGTPLLQRMDNKGNTRTVKIRGDKGVYLEGDLAVLIDNNSASAAEIVSSALKESGRADLYGVTTFGTGTVLNAFDLSDGSTAVLGVELFKTGEGNDIYRVGVAPTNDVPMPKDTRPHMPFEYNARGDQEIPQATFDKIEDAQLKAAYESLAGKN